MKKEETMNYIGIGNVVIVECSDAAQRRLCESRLLSTGIMNNPGGSRGYRGCQCKLRCWTLPPVVQVLMKKVLTKALAKDVWI